MRKVRNMFAGFIASVALVVSLTACGGGTPTPTPTNAPPAPTQPPVVQPTPDPGQACVTSVVTVEYENGTSETLTVDLLRHETRDNRYNTRIQRFNEDGSLKDTISFTIVYNDDGGFSGSGSKLQFVHGAAVTTPLTVTTVIKLSSC